jgi:hypothetical protein
MCSAQYGEFLKEAKKRLPAVKNIEGNIKCIREKVNFVAHYGQRLDKEFDEKDVKSNFRKVDLWIIKEDALEVLKKNGVNIYQNSKRSYRTLFLILPIVFTPIYSLMSYLSIFRNCIMATFSISVMISGSAFVKSFGIAK